MSVTDRVFEYALKEKNRQSNCLSLIASENLIYPEALKIAQFPLLNKYVEGYPNRRFYSGCENVDRIEEIAIQEATKAFKCRFANVQPYSGSIANAAIYKALLKPKDVILGLEMSGGGHLTHSSSLSFVSHFYKVYSYPLDPDTLRIDYGALEKIALQVKPKLIIAGGSSYPYSIDFRRFREIADLVGAYLLADICHYSSLVISGLHQHCFPHAHVAMCTTHKQLRGAKGAIILWNDPELTDPINKAVFPGMQGGVNVLSLSMNAIALCKANESEYLDYANKVVSIAKAMCDEFTALGAKVIGTETHMFLIDTKTSFNLTGKEAADILEGSGIIVNQNLIPFDNESPLVTSGIRIGSLVLASLGWDIEQCKLLAFHTYRILSSIGEGRDLEAAKAREWIKSILNN
ncbi:serine hydroxymethyltransferase [Mycoplasma haemofelis Ohio2]|uniref:Serine hydroxymethyltransferase n=1 Tax=Mycoplasma haemofelis (strain Ohio2) TaxID=859194 RepID=F6FFL8_MYCHI|nr:serine hydroxymethyltransferase [Mycoplasma haemofelis Ohio2]